MSNSGTIKTLTNSGAMRGASSFNVTTTGVLGGAGGAGLANSGTIATLTNKGTISGGKRLSRIGRRHRRRRHSEFRDDYEPRQ